MHPENLLLSAISAITAALVFVAKLLWVRSEKCEIDRANFATLITNLQNDHLEYVKLQATTLTTITVNNTIALQDNTRALQALTKLQT